MNDITKTNKAEKLESAFSSAHSIIHKAISEFWSDDLNLEDGLERLKEITSHNLFLSSGIMHRCHIKFLELTDKDDFESVEAFMGVCEEVTSEIAESFKAAVHSRLACFLEEVETHLEESANDEQIH